MDVTITVRSKDLGNFEVEVDNYDIPFGSQDERGRISSALVAAVDRVIDVYQLPGKVEVNYGN